MDRRTALTLSFLFLTALSCSKDKAPAAKSQPSADAAVAPDAGLTAVSRALAGLAPEGGRLARATGTDAWRKHAAFFAAQWPPLRDDRFKTAAQWRDAEMKVPPSAAKTLMYPFSGPDFLNARLFFPRAEDYIFYSLEPVGAVPDLERMADADAAGLFREIQDSLDELFKKSYFVTVKMRKELHAEHLKGNTPLFLVFLALMDCPIVSVEEVTLDGTGSVVARTEGGAPGVRIVFLDGAAGKPRTLLYFSLDVSNPGLENHPGFPDYLRKNAPAATLLKSASYLMQDKSFSKIRKTILDTTDYLLQDDSGMPFWILGRKRWDITLYGNYLGPKRDFPTAHQESLKKAYGAPNAAKPLPFHFGYHWEENRESCVQVALKKPSMAASRAR